MSNSGTGNIAIYAFSLGKFLEHGKYACVKDLTNIMSALKSEKYKFWLICPISMKGINQIKQMKVKVRFSPKKFTIFPTNEKLLNRTSYSNFHIVQWNCIGVS